jgi:hypothetical protein
MEDDALTGNPSKGYMSRAMITFHFDNMMTEKHPVVTFKSIWPSQSDDARVDLKFPAIYETSQERFAQCYVCGVIEIIVQSALMSAGGRIKYLIKYLISVSYKALMASYDFNLSQPTAVCAALIYLAYIPHTAVFHISDSD